MEATDACRFLLTALTFISDAVNCELNTPAGLLTYIGDLFGHVREFVALLMFMRMSEESICSSSIDVHLFK